MALKIFGGLIAVVIVGIGLVFATGNAPAIGLAWTFAFGGPPLPVDLTATAPKPDYANPHNWAGLPSRRGPEDLTPPGHTAATQGSAPVDVFFVHPTGYLSDGPWVFSMDTNTATEENTVWMMANQASAYNGCCNVYAPRYRQANIFAYFHGDDVREEVLGFAYQDVLSAFEHFLSEFNDGRPFVLASHSQGTHHSIRLLQERISSTPLVQRLVAAYIIGGSISQREVDEMSDISVCASANDLGCVIHWDTYSDSAIESDLSDSAENVCVNPLSWQQNGGLIPATQHLGAVPMAGMFNTEFGTEDVYQGVDFSRLGKPLPNLLAAQCQAGTLFVSDQSDNEFGNSSNFGGGSYHVMDYPLFHVDIRHNVQGRVTAFLGLDTTTE
ncbi:MAG: DUF3089 domain-containing protein [Pseudomonadales bacterium]|nr:DUF3089 domain-containing protein [Pseudomonadales bacterium]